MTVGGGRDRHVVYGIHAVNACLRTPGTRVERLMVREGTRSARLEEVVALAGARGCEVLQMPAERLDEIAPGVHQGVALVLNGPQTLTEDALATILERPEGALLLLVLDGVTDPRNLGACLRSAAATGVDALIVPKDKSAPLSEVAIKTASGGAAMVPVVRVVNLARTLEKLKRKDVWVVGTVTDSGHSLAGIDLSSNVALVMGGEGRGLRPNTRRHCDVLAHIPMMQSEPGFNVAVAAGICLYEARRQRGPSDSSPA